MKPRIFWTFYPKSNRGYWRVSKIPRHPTPEHLQLWGHAHRLKMAMNEALEPSR